MLPRVHRHTAPCNRYSTQRDGRRVAVAHSPQQAYQCYLLALLRTARAVAGTRGNNENALYRTRLEHSACRSYAARTTPQWGIIITALILPHTALLFLFRTAQPPTYPYRVSLNSRHLASIDHDVTGTPLAFKTDVFAS